jgi:hypothetical protein
MSDKPINDGWLPMWLKRWRLRRVIRNAVASTINKELAPALAVQTMKNAMSDEVENILNQMRGTGHTFTINEGQRQMLLLALAILTKRSPGFDYANGEIAEVLKGRVIYENFKKFNAHLGAAVIHGLNPAMQADAATVAEAAPIQPQSQPRKDAQS